MAQAQAVQAQAAAAFRWEQFLNIWDHASSQGSRIPIWPAIPWSRPWPSWLATIYATKCQSWRWSWSSWHATSSPPPSPTSQWRPSPQPICPATLTAGYEKCASAWEERAPCQEAIECFYDLHEGTSSSVGMSKKLIFDKFRSSAQLFRLSAPWRSLPQSTRYWVVGEHCRSIWERNRLRSVGDGWKFIVCDMKTSSHSCSLVMFLISYVNCLLIYISQFWNFFSSSRWHALSKEEQGSYYERAREEKVYFLPLDLFSSFAGFRSRIINVNYAIIESWCSVIL